MPTWSDILKEIQLVGAQTAARGGPLDTVRRKYLAKLQKKRGRNIICYYSGWLQRPNLGNTEIDDNDKNAFMTTVHGLDRSKGLDLILHTPGGQVAAAESLVDYLRTLFNGDIVAFVPQLAMSAGTMISCACKEIYMGKQSSLGPIDPQFNGIPAAGVIEEYHTAIREIAQNPASVEFWKIVIGKYHPTFLLDCLNAINWSKQLVSDWLKTGMFAGKTNAAQLAQTATDGLSNWNQNKSHARHFNVGVCQGLGLEIVELEKDQVLQDLVLTVHHTYMHTFSASTAVKIIENHKGVAMVILGEQRR